MTTTTFDRCNFTSMSGLTAGTINCMFTRVTWLKRTSANTRNAGAIPLTPENHVVYVTVRPSSFDLVR